MGESVRVIVEVTAGLLPGTPDDQYTRNWQISSTEWNELEPSGYAEVLAQLNGRAQGYAMLLMLQPDRLNWVRTDWAWL